MHPATLLLLPLIVLGCESNSHEGISRDFISGAIFASLLTWLVLRTNPTKQEERKFPHDSELTNIDHKDAAAEQALLANERKLRDLAQLVIALRQLRQSEGLWNDTELAKAEEAAMNRVDSAASYYLYLAQKNGVRFKGP